MKLRLAIIDIDGTIAEFPRGCLPIPIADLSGCTGLGCQYYDPTGSGCLRTSRCRWADHNHFDHFFTNDTILNISVRGNAVTVLRDLESEGWFLAYVSGRPEPFRTNTRKWLTINGFPRGLVSCAGTPDRKFVIVNWLVSRLMPSQIICLEDDLLTRGKYVQLYGAVNEFERIVP